MGIYIFGGTDENDRKLMYAGTQNRQVQRSSGVRICACTVTLENAVQWQLSHTNIKYIQCRDPSTVVFHARCFAV